MARAGDGKERSDKRQADQRLTKRLTLAERAAFEDRALMAGFSSGQAYLSAFILGQTGQEIRLQKIKALGHLGKVGGNLNQIAKRLNRAATPELMPADLRVIAEVLDAVQVLGAEIREGLK
ncbi:MAG: hypothetical protein A3D16_07725 [Rhodobacterales bacterium RIFCSPHIGHO2_02_FULL_62_130]|jgi:hypothetical protein|nr:MAG: hypothetical protein A3D16_07725 [Rhodobacterales bacterium RIFCSPHIGHO2_02_FULL_62_130]OHC57319.1 MAG: hypothetical protein A3E48_05605 [Rhodobacterales bacterium RIFCSPHIGHO2_12_FULL_62_75]HCZ01487.1 hypothetical protein [Rhodobacter sp.]